MFANNVQETTSTTGTGTLSLDGAPTGRRKFVDGFGSGATALYTIEDPTTGAKEIGLGVITAGSPDTLTRATIVWSTNSNALVNFAGGTKNVFCAADADSIRFGGAQAPTATGTANALAVAYIPAVTRLVDGRVYPFVNGAAANTGAATVDLGPGGKNARRPDGTATQANDMPAGRLLFVMYRQATDDLWLTDLPSVLAAGAVGTAELAAGAVTAAKESNDDYEDIASAATVDLSAATKRNVRITGSTGPITSFGALPAGRVVKVKFASTPTLTYNGTSQILQTSASIVAEAGDTCEVIGRGSGNNEVRNYQRFSGRALVASAVIVDRAYDAYTTSASLTTNIPYDDTIPQNTEGTQVLTAPITPKTTTNRVRVRAVLWGGPATSDGQMIAALFRNSTANALHTVSARGLASSPVGTAMLVLEFEDSPGSVSTQTYNIRVGGPSGGSIWLNGDSAGRKFGGASRCTLVLEEITA
jgi:hypothetical protein